MTISTESFFRTVSSVTGQELPTFLEQWIHTGGHAKFRVSNEVLKTKVMNGYFTNSN